MTMQTLMPSPANLRQLKALLETGAIWEGAPMNGNDVDWTDLPVFGGPVPQNTREIWSWDHNEMLVGPNAANLAIVPREDA